MPVKKALSGRPTDAELAILRVLWEKGEATVREVHDELSRDKPQVYTTVLKFLQIMTDKGLVRRDESARSHVYRASAPPDKMRKSMLRDLVQKVFGGSTRALVQQALGSGKVTAEEISEIRRLLDDIERKR